MKLYGNDWRILACEGCGKPMGDNTMGGLHVTCQRNPDPGNRKSAPAYRRVTVVPLTLNEQRALVVRIDGSQTQARLPDYKALLASAREKLDFSSAVSREGDSSRSAPVSVGGEDQPSAGATTSTNGEAA